MDNPYASPESDPPAVGNRIIAGEKNPLRIPAAILIVFATLFLLLWIVALPMMVTGIRAIDTSTPYGMGHVTGQILFLVGTLASNSVIVLGAIAMLRRRHYALANSAAIVACIPICSPFYLLGIPFGIWALWQIGRPEVRARFS